VISLETDRLVIRSFCLEDWQELWELAARYQASEWAKYDHPWPISTEEVKDMAEWFAGDDGYLAVCLKSAGKLIGLLNFSGRVACYPAAQPGQRVNTTQERSEPYVHSCA
jgi:hypothetical protein